MLSFNNQSYQTFGSSQHLTVFNKYDISEQNMHNFNALRGFKLVLICDDSTSMKEVLRSSGQPKWNELRKLLAIILEIASAFDVECDVLFLNRTGLRNVRNINQLNQQFFGEPYGNFVNRIFLAIFFKYIKQILSYRNYAPGGML